MSHAKPVIWGATTTRTLRVIWTAEEVGLDYRLRKIGPRTGETQSAEFTALNPKQKIPLLVDGDFKLSESLAICRYLAENYAQDGALYRPRTVREQARYDEWCAFILAELDATSLYIVRRHVGLAHIYGGAPVAVEAAKAYFSRQAQAASELLTGNFVMGEKFGVADVMLSVCLSWARASGIEIPENLEVYRQRTTRRAAYRRADEINGIDWGERGS